MAPQVIVLKLDDITTDRAPRWQRVTDFLEENDLKASYGIIGFSLEDDNPAYFKWIKDQAFGPHWSHTNEATAKALEEIPGITMWFHGRSKNTSKFLFKRVLTLENPTHVPDFEKFKQRYEQVARNEECLALQGHPNSWDDARWATFVKIIQYLKAQGCVFMTPSEYLASMKP